MVLVRYAVLWTEEPSLSQLNEFNVCKIPRIEGSKNCCSSICYFIVSLARCLPLLVTPLSWRLSPTRYNHSRFLRIPYLQWKPDINKVWTQDLPIPSHPPVRLDSPDLRTWLDGTTQCFLKGLNLISLRFKLFCPQWLYVNLDQTLGQTMCLYTSLIVFVT